MTLIPKEIYVICVIRVQFLGRPYGTTDFGCSSYPGFCRTTYVALRIRGYYCSVLQAGLILFIKKKIQTK